MTKVALIAMRLKDMWKLHPDQDNSRVCSKCGEGVGIYPSGQNALARAPSMRIVCAICANPQPGDENYPAAPWDEIAREIKQSQRRS